MESQNCRNCSPLQRTYAGQNNATTANQALITMIYGNLCHMASSSQTPSQVFSVFVNNIPPNIHWRWLKQIFQHHGNVVDVFIPHKRSRSGRKYGFVRFSSLQDAKYAAEKLNGAWFLDYRMGVNLAKFNARSAFWRRVDSQKDKPLQGTSKHDVGQKFQQKSQYSPEPSGNLNERRSYKQVLLNEEMSEKELDHYQFQQEICHAKIKTCKGMVDDSLLHKLERCVIGVARDYYEANTLMENFKIQGVFDISVKKISGRQFLISFEEVETMKTMKNLGWSWLKEWFVDIFHWSEDMEYKYRTTWVIVYGVPLHAWNYNTFKNIAEIWGDLLSMDGNTLKFTDFSRGAFFLMTDQVERIDEVINLECGKKTFKVRVSEVGSDVVSLFNYCCKQSKTNNPVTPLPSPWANSEEEDGADHEESSSSRDKSTPVSKPCENLSSTHSPDPISKIGADPTSTALPDQVSNETVPGTLPDCTIPIDVNATVVSSANSQKQHLSSNKETNLNLEIKINELQAFCPPDSCDGSTKADLKEVEDEIENGSSCDIPARKRSLKFKPRNRSIQGMKKFRTLEDVEDSLLLKKGKKKLTTQKKKIMKKGNLQPTKAANESLSDGDFINRRKVLEKEARETWEVGKMMGFQTDMCEEQIIENLVRLEERE